MQREGSMLTNVQRLRQRVIDQKPNSKSVNEAVEKSKRRPADEMRIFVSDSVHEAHGGYTALGFVAKATLSAAFMKS